jgi:3-oxoadipate enol-lactonase
MMEGTGKNAAPSQESAPQGDDGLIRRLQLAGGEMVIAEHGEGDPLLLVHGFPVDRRMWRGQIGALPGLRLLLPDLRGHGESEPSPPPYTLIDLAEDLRQLLDHLALERVMLGGLSMGGYVALAFAARYPERLRAFFLFDTHPKPDTPEGRRGRAETAARVRRGGVSEVADEQVDKLVGGRNVDPEVVALTRKMVLDMSIEGMVGSLTAMAARLDSTPVLPTILCPTMVLVGSEDAITPPTMAREMAAAIPGAELVEIPAAGHLAPLEQPAAVNAAMRDFITRRVTARASSPSSGPASSSTRPPAPPRRTA